MKRVLLAAFGGLGLVAAEAALAAEEILPEIEVTTDRTEEQDSQDTPLAVSVLDGETLRRSDVTDFAGIAQRTPGLTVSGYNQGQITPYIRGIGSNEDGAGGDGSVGVFLDDVYLGRGTALAADLFDLDRVEVLRGPQGTLYGRNVVGGAIRLITRQPDEQPMQRVEASLGNLDFRQARFALSGPVGESRVYGSLSGMFKQRDGYLVAVDGTEQLGQDRRGVRGELAFYPTNQTEVRFSADLSTLDESGPNRHLEGYLNDTIIRPLNPEVANDIRRSYELDPGREEGRFGGIALHVDQELGWATLASITALRRSDMQVDDVYRYDNEALLSSPGFIPYKTPITHGSNYYDENADQFSQEFRLSDGGGNAEHDVMHWQAGLYFLRESVFRQEDFDFDAILDRGVELEGGKGTTDQDNVTRSYAAFGQATYPLDKQWSLTAGARYTRDHKEITQAGTKGGSFILEDYRVSGDDAWGRLTPKLSLDYRPAEQLLSYLSYSRGYKSGGYQGQAPTAVAAATAFEPEVADSYELGVKWEREDRRLRLNAAAFYIDYRNLQVNELFSPVEAPVGDIGVLMTFNAADARSRGFELEGAMIPAAGWTLAGSYAFLDATYTDFQLPSDLGFRFTNPEDRSGNRLRNAPRHTASLSVDYLHALADGGELDTRLEYQFQSKNYLDSANTDASAIPAYGLVNLRSAWRPTKQLEIAGWIHNLLDEDYLLHANLVRENVLVVPGLPRTFGVTLSYDFSL